MPVEDKEKISEGEIQEKGREKKKTLMTGKETEIINRQKKIMAVPES